MTTRQDGMTLIEAVTTVAIFAVVSVSLYTIITLAVQLVRDDQSRLDAVAVAQTAIEQLHNVPYEDIGTVGGIPNGSFPQSTTEVHNQTTYTIETDIRYVDDPFDDTAPADLVSTDYKQVRVEVMWEGQYVDEPVLLVTTIAPDGLETNGGGGTLWIEVYDASANPISNATLHITNTLVSPTVDITSATDSSGRYILPGTPASIQGYHVVVSKSGYSSTQTYTTDPVTNPNPDPSDQTVVESEITTKVFYIDLVSDFTIHVQDSATGLPANLIPVDVVGAKRIGTDLEGIDVPKYDQTHITDSNGDITLTGIEYDTYTLSFEDETTGLDLAGMSLPLPYVLAPNTSGSVTLLTSADADHTFLVTVQDGSESPLEGATVHISTQDLGVDISQTTNASGQTFFTPLTAEIYTVEVTLAGYDLFSDQFDITDDVRQVIPLTLTP